VSPFPLPRFTRSRSTTIADCPALCTARWSAGREEAASRGSHQSAEFTDDEDEGRGEGVDGEAGAGRAAGEVCGDVV